jgi:acyl-CoA synthetase (NDP forming)
VRAAQVGEVIGTDATALVAGVRNDDHYRPMHRVGESGKLVEVVLDTAPGEGGQAGDVLVRGNLGS